MLNTNSYTEHRYNSEQKKPSTEEQTMLI